VLSLAHAIEIQTLSSQGLISQCCPKISDHKENKIRLNPIKLKHWLRI
jgi:hypothetical protein